jgi:hypothetical protein
VHGRLTGSYPASTTGLVPGSRLVAGFEAHEGTNVVDLPALKTLITSAGYSFNADEPLEGYDRIYVNHPFGNRIELMEPLSK